MDGEKNEELEPPLFHFSFYREQIEMRIRQKWELVQREINDNSIDLPVKDIPFRQYLNCIFENEILDKYLVSYLEHNIDRQFPVSKIAVNKTWSV